MLCAGWYEDNWFEVNLEKEGIECTVEQMRIAAEGHLTTEALMWNRNLNERTISGMTSEDFRIKLDQILKNEGYDIDNQRYPEGYQEAPLAYDAVWSVALGEFQCGAHTLIMRALLRMCQQWLNPFEAINFTINFV